MCDGKINISVGIIYCDDGKTSASNGIIRGSGNKNTIYSAEQINLDGSTSMDVIDRVTGEVVDTLVFKPTTPNDKFHN